jgi:hypothetical protein
MSSRTRGRQTGSVGELAPGAVRTVRHRFRRRLVTREVNAPAFVLIVPALIALHAAERENEDIVVNRLFHRPLDAPSLSVRTGRCL